MGVDPEERPVRHSRHDFNAPPRLLGTRNQIIGGAIFGFAYIIAFFLRGLYLPGLAGGVLGGVLLFLLLKEADARKVRRFRRHSQERSDGSGSIG